MGHYRSAQVCLNGHQITDNIEDSPAFMSEFCSTCGEKTIRACPNCQSQIRGDYVTPGVAVIGFGYTPPRFCHACGKPYPWVQHKLDAAKEMADELEGLSAEDRERLKQSLEDLTRDTPKTDTAILKYKMIAKKVGGAAGAMLNKIIAEIATEYVKKQMGL
jgi:hypothetical protein